MNYYMQCKISHISGKVDICYIPEKYAAVGKYLNINKEIGWTVLEVYSRSRLPEHVVKERNKDYRRMSTFN